MKIHIVQRNDTFQSIAEKYNVSVQDLIGMNTHINHLAGLVPGLKVKVPSPVRKDESNVAQHIQKYYPNLDTNPVELKTITTVEPEPVVVKQQEQVKKVQPVPVQVKEEAIPIPLKPMQSEVPTKPNDEVKVGGTIASVEQYNVSVSQKTYEQPKQTASTSAKAQTVASSTSTPQVPPYPLLSVSPTMYPPYVSNCSSQVMPYPDLYNGGYSMPSTYGGYQFPYSNPYPMRSGQDERFFIGGFGGYPFFGGWGGWGGFYPNYGRWGWGGYYPNYGRWGWGRYPYF